MEHTTRKIIISSIVCGICTGIICSLLWLAISGVNWIGFLEIDLFFLINACLGGIIAALIHSKFSRCPIFVDLYIGNTLPAGIFLLFFLLIADHSTKAWGLVFLIGWLIISLIPVAITSILLKILNDTKKK